MDDAGHWVKFVVVQTELTPERPHGLRYSLTLHAPDGARLVGFDNAHPVRERRGPGGGRRLETDHRHRLRTIRPYEYENAAKLITDFSGRKWTRCFEREDQFHEDTEDRYRRL